MITTLFLGAVFGCIYALIAYGLVLTFRTSGVFNFAQGAIGMLFAFVYYQLQQGGRMNLVKGVYDMKWHLPIGIALPLVVLVLAPLLGIALDLVLFRRLRDAGAVVQIVATIGLLLAFQGVAGVVWGSATTLTPHSIFGEHVFAPLHGHPRLLFPAGELATVVLVLALCVGLLLFLRFSPLGIRMRAVVDRPELSEAMGVNSAAVSGLSWAVATSFAALAGILIAPFYGSLDTRTLTFLVVAATAAAVVGKLESLPLTLLGAFGVGIAQLLTQKYVHGEFGRELRPSIPFVVLFAVLLLPVRWPSTARIGAPRLATRSGTERTPAARALRVGILGAVLVLLPFVAGSPLSTLLGGDWQRKIVLVPPMALIFLSLVVLTGFAGQISLCQGALAGVSAFIAGQLMVDHHFPFLLAVLLAPIVSLAMGAVLAWRATRLPPLFLGLASLALGAAVDEVLFTNPSFSNGLTGISVNRPEFLAGDRAYYLAGLVVFGLAALLTNNLRRGRTGLALAGMRDSQVGLASLGGRVARLRLVSFCLSAFLAGVGGALFAGARQLATPTDWFTLLSLLFLALAVIGGIASWQGALVGATLFQLFAPILHQPFFQRNVAFKWLFHGQLEALLPVLFGLGAIGLAQNPHGIIEQNREGFRQFRERLASWRAMPGPALATSAPRPVEVAEVAIVADAKPVRLTNATFYHRHDCPLTRGKEAKPVRGKGRGLAPCPVCEPVPVA